MSPLTITVPVEWHECRDGYPDADQTVLIALDETHGEPVTAGWWDGEQWLDMTAYPLTGVTHWAEMPMTPVARRAAR